ncbi:MAG TPA: FliH/SctL family protein [Noviherbaspirillum sp.]
MDSVIRKAAVASERRQIGRPGRAGTPLDASYLPQQAVQPNLEAAHASLSDYPAERASSPATPAFQMEALEAALRLKYEEARDKALLEVRERAIQAEREAYEAGFKKGEEDARHAAGQQFERLEKLIGSLGAARQQVIDESQDSIVEIAFSALCRIVGDAAMTREVVIGMARQAIARCRDREPITIHLNPQDCALLQQADLSSVTFEDRITLERDPSIRLGGCIIDGATGTLDARLEVQLERLRETLVAARHAADGMEGPV